MASRPDELFNGAKIVNEKPAGFEALFKLGLVEVERLFDELHASGQIRRVYGDPRAKTFQHLETTGYDSEVSHGGGAHSAQPLAHPGNIAALISSPPPGAPADPPDEPLARLRLAQKRLKEHSDKTCPNCQKTTLSFQDEYEAALDRVTRTWACASCQYTSSAVGVPISGWPSDKQSAWYSKVAEQRARKQIIRCPNCGNESLDAKESGVVGVGTSEHVILSCKNPGCTFKEREIERSIVGTGKSLLRRGVLFVLVAAGLVLVGWALRQAINTTISSVWWSARSQGSTKIAPPPVPKEQPSPEPANLVIASPVNVDLDDSHVRVRFSIANNGARPVTIVEAYLCACRKDEDGVSDLCDSIGNIDPLKHPAVVAGGTMVVHEAEAPFYVADLYRNAEKLSPGQGVEPGFKNAGLGVYFKVVDSSGMICETRMRFDDIVIDQKRWHRHRAVPPVAAIQLLRERSQCTR